MSKYTFPLKVAKPSGERVMATITNVGPTMVLLEIEQLDAVRNDKDDKSKDGIIKVTYPRTQHVSVIQSLTKYLESLMLKELDRGNNNSSNEGRSNAGRSKGKTNSRTTKKSKGKSSGSVHNSGGGTKSSESIGGRSAKSDVAKSGDSPDSTEGEIRD